MKATGKINIGQKFIYEDDSEFPRRDKTYDCYFIFKTKKYHSTIKFYKVIKVLNENLNLN